MFRAKLDLGNARSPSEKKTVKTKLSLTIHKWPHFGISIYFNFSFNFKNIDGGIDYSPKKSRI